MTMDSFNVFDKEAKENRCDFPKLGEKLQGLDAFTSKAIMAHHDHDHDDGGNQHRPFPSSSETWVGDDDGPTCNDRAIPITNDAYHVVASRSGAAVTSAGTIVRAVQPFDISPTTALQTASKSPGRMATTTTSSSLGFPFTNAQWKELERQAMIYKYMMAAVPVPPELLIPVSRTSSDPAASHSPLASSGLKLRLSSSTDPEPGRCKRTDGKKWRCSRDVAPDYKYCERHLHRGRPRSRKPVEVHANKDNIKRSRREDYQPLPTPPVSNPTVNNIAFSSQFLGPTTGQLYQHQPTVVSVASHKEPRSLDWMLKGEPVPMATTVQQWQSLMQNKMELTYGPSFYNANATAFKQNYSEPEEPLNVNSYAYFSSCEDPRNKDCCLFLNPDMVSNHQERNTGTTRGFIDAWSNAVTEENIANSSAMCSVSSDGLSPSSLTLSMGGSNSIEEEIGQIHMGLGQIERDRNNESVSKSHLSSWLTPASSVAPAPGGPLAEVLRPSTVATTAGAASEPSTPIAGNGDSSSSPAIMVSSSPSGVLQKTFASFSDSSGNSSPILGSSRVNPEIALPWLN